LYDCIRKKQQIIQKIQAMPDNLIDEMADFIELFAKEKELSRDEKFMKLLNETNLKYKKV
jgi:hypothetical protein